MRDSELQPLTRVIFESCPVCISNFQWIQGVIGIFEIASFADHKCTLVVLAFFSLALSLPWILMAHIYKTQLFLLAAYSNDKDVKVIFSTSPQAIRAPLQISHTVS